LEAAAAEPLAVAEHAINRSAISAGNSATVIGSGPIGIGVLLGLQRRGVDEVYVVEPSRRRRLTAARLGASTVDPVNGDPGELIHGLRDGRGVDVSFDTVGKPASFEASIRSVRPGGVTVLLASGRLDSVSSGPIVASEIEVRGSLSYTDEFHMVVGLLATGAYRIREWVSVITLDEIVRGFESLRSGDYMKLLVDPRAP
jgi:(R,R)-butanediol dehydrogenase/meso-butanediol dehydrogenase/diacetyl reductase